MRAILIMSLLLMGCSQKIEVTSTQQKIEKPVEIIALQYIGYSERTHRKELKEFIGVDPVRVEWCAAFVNAVLAETGILGSETVSNDPLTARSFLSWGMPVLKPEPGDIVVFPRGKELWSGHVGFYLRSQIINGIEYYYILGGNQNNRVSIQLFKSSQALGIRRSKTA